MKKIMFALGVLTICGAAQAQVLGRTVTLQQTGICPVLGCNNIQETHISPRIRYVEGRGANQQFGGGVAAFFVDGRLAALGWQEIGNYDSVNIGMNELNQIFRIGIGQNAPNELRQYIQQYSGIDHKIGGRNIAVGNGILISVDSPGRRGLMLVHRDYYQIVTSTINRSDSQNAHALLQQFFRINDIRFSQMGNNYTIPYSERVIDLAHNFFSGRGLEPSACCGHPGMMFKFPALSRTTIDFWPGPLGDRLRYSFVNIIVEGP